MTNAKLTVRAAGEADREIDLDGEVSIGRARDNSIAIDDGTVSQYHAVIEARGAGFWLSDLGSTNGTVVNGEAIAFACELKDGDLISIGDAATLAFHAGAAAALSPAR